MNLADIDPMIFVVFVQIFIESFPISSSGHVFLFERLFSRFGIDAPNTLPSFFDHFLHGPTILILMLVFFKDWFEPVKKLFIGFFSGVRRDSYKRLCLIFFKIVGYVCVTTLIVVPAWGLQNLYLKNMNWFASDYSTLFGFCVTAILLLLLFLKEAVRMVRQAHHERGVKLFRNLKDRNFDTLNIRKVLIIGFVQAISLMPGISRFASVYVTSRLLNISPRRAIQFTFLIQFPLIVPAFFLGFFSLLKQPNWRMFFTWQMNLTLLISSILSFFALLWIKKLALNKKLGWFAFYMLIPILLMTYLLIK